MNAYTAIVYRNPLIFTSVFVLGGGREAHPGSRLFSHASNQQEIRLSMTGIDVRCDACKPALAMTYISLRPSSARCTVLSSAYSMSLPTGRP